ncbi:MAG: DUF3536 domain-containing protein [Fibrobacteria bacterium]|nr:DUF3536 domain-containing protein [Fibrobacteria bacterium]
MNRYICIHGHFYQPPRENPWLEEVESQDSAYPFHDWNQRINAECYDRNAHSRILDNEGKITEIVNNYAQISFNFGPTLLSWMERHAPTTYQSILEADKLGMERFSGHGPALAQCYNHMIMPLANERDKRTQIIWGLQDFQARFQRQAEGMWLPETAVCLKTLDILSEYGIKFTILAPNQAYRVRPLGETDWQDTATTGLDPKRPYLCKLPSGRTMALFFYDGPISHDLAFGQLLQSGNIFADRLKSAFAEGDNPQLVHIATDGETYGSHQRHSDMALAYCLHELEYQDDVQVTIYGEYLEKFPPDWEAEIHENSSWSCVHGIERWRNACGCNSGGNGGWNQDWRAPLRGTLDWLRDNLVHLYEEGMAPYTEHPWECRDQYIDIIRDRNMPPQKVLNTLQIKNDLDTNTYTRIIKLLEMQRNAMLMYTSCGWFFDEVSGIETTQIIAYAVRAIQLAEETGAIALSDTFRTLLKKAPSNIPDFGNGEYVYDNFVKPSKIDLPRVGAHFAICSLFENVEELTTIYCYHIKNVEIQKKAIGKNSFISGQVGVTSHITREEGWFEYIVVSFGDHNVVCGLRPQGNQDEMDTLTAESVQDFERNSMSEVISSFERNFTFTYSLWDLFHDQQRKIVNQILQETIDTVADSFRQMKMQYDPVFEMMQRMGIPLPRVFSHITELVNDESFYGAVDQEPPDLETATHIAKEVKRMRIKFDRLSASFLVAEKINTLVEKIGSLESDEEKTDSLTIALGLFEAVRPLDLELDVWRAQNACALFLQQMQAQDASSKNPSPIWMSKLNELADVLSIKVVL